MVNRLVGQYRNRRVPFAKRLRFSRRVGSENWRYLPEESTNHETVSTTRLSDNGFGIMPRKVCLLESKICS
jgi:hypothetical protein